MATRLNRVTVVAAAAACVLLAAAGSSMAQVLPYGPVLYRVTATSTLPSGQVVSNFVEWSSNDGNYSSDPGLHTGNDGLWTGYDHYSWVMSIPTSIMGSYTDGT